MTPAVPHGADEILLGFAHALRAAGITVTHDRAVVFLRAAMLLGLADPEAVRVAGRATLCASPDDLAVFDDVFWRWFGQQAQAPRSPHEQLRDNEMTGLSAEDGRVDGDDVEDDNVAAEASGIEVLRNRDVAALTPVEKVLLDQLIGQLHPTAPMRRVLRRVAAPRGNGDRARTLRRMMRRMGEPAELAWRAPAERPRRLVLLIDVSGSMSSYSDALLRLAHRFVRSVPTTEVFTFGTRLTRITLALRTADADRALIRAGRTVPDWAGGTRLGENLEGFLDRWGRRGLARQATVVVFSDGWERGDTAVLREQAQRLRRIAHKLIWVNPHRGKPGYEPVQSGIVAVLPYVDDFVAGHSCASFQALCEVVARG